MSIVYEPQKEEIKSGPETGKVGYVRDFITNTWIKATPEEIEAKTGKPVISKLSLKKIQEQKRFKGK